MHGHVLHENGHLQILVPQELPLWPQWLRPRTPEHSAIRKCGSSTMLPDPAEWEELRRSTPLEVPSWLGWPLFNVSHSWTNSTRRLTDPLAVLAVSRTQTAAAPIVLRKPAILTRKFLPTRLPSARGASLPSR